MDVKSINTTTWFRSLFLLSLKHIPFKISLQHWFLLNIFRAIPNFPAEYLLNIIKHFLDHSPKFPIEFSHISFWHTLWICHSSILQLPVFISFLCVSFLVSFCLFLVYPCLFLVPSCFFQSCSSFFLIFNTTERPFSYIVPLPFCLYSFQEFSDFLHVFFIYNHSTAQI